MVAVMVLREEHSCKPIARPGAVSTACGGGPVRSSAAWELKRRV